MAKKPVKSGRPSRFSPYEALERCERRLADAEAAREKAEKEILRLRGVIDDYEREAEQKYHRQSQEAIKAANQRTERLRSQIAEFVAAFETMRNSVGAADVKPTPYAMPSSLVVAGLKQSG